MKIIRFPKTWDKAEAIGQKDLAVADWLRIEADTLRRGVADGLATEAALFAAEQMGKLAARLSRKGSRT